MFKKLIKFIFILLIIFSFQTAFSGSGIPVTFFGNTIPEREVHIKVDGLPEEVVLSNENGYFRKTISNVPSGIQRVIFWVQDKWENVGTEAELYISVPEGITETAVSNIDLSFTEGEVREKPKEKECPRNPDFNQDGRVNIQDFSILLFWWNTDECKIDLNADGMVNIFDFGVLIYHWTG